MHQINTCLFHGCCKEFGIHAWNVSQIRKKLNFHFRAVLGTFLRISQTEGFQYMNSKLCITQHLQIEGFQCTVTEKYLQTRSNNLIESKNKITFFSESSRLNEFFERSMKMHNSIFIRNKFYKSFEQKICFEIIFYFFLKNQSKKKFTQR